MTRPHSPELYCGIDLAAGPHRTAFALVDPPAAWLAVLAERIRQVRVEGWTPEHDDAHSEGELGIAAYEYITHAIASLEERADFPPGQPSDSWPWEDRFWKPTTPERDLEKGLALGLAELERLHRARFREAQ